MLKLSILSVFLRLQTNRKLLLIRVMQSQFQPFIFMCFLVLYVKFNLLTLKFLIN
mgnify:CR=1 FL=1